MLCAEYQGLPLSVLYTFFVALCTLYARACTELSRCFVQVIWENWSVAQWGFNNAHHTLSQNQLFPENITRPLPQACLLAFTIAPTSPYLIHSHVTLLGHIYKALYGLLSNTL